VSPPPPRTFHMGADEEHSRRGLAVRRRRPGGEGARTRVHWQQRARRRRPRPRWAWARRPGGRARPHGGRARRLGSGRCFSCAMPWRRLLSPAWRVRAGCPGLPPQIHSEAQAPRGSRGPGPGGCRTPQRTRRQARPGAGVHPPGARAGRRLRAPSAAPGPAPARRKKHRPPRRRQAMGGGVAVAVAVAVAGRGGAPLRARGVRALRPCGGGPWPGRRATPPARGGPARARRATGSCT
jgi:hypothetical protein